MPVDTSIYGNLIRPVSSLQENISALDAAELQKTQLAGAKLNLIGQQQAQADQQAVRALYQRPGFDPNTPAGIAALSAASPTAGQAARKTALDNAKTQADIAHLGAQTDAQKSTAAKNQFDLARQKLELGTSIVTSANTPADAHARFQQAVAQGLMSPEEAAQKEQEVPNDPAAFADWKKTSALALLTASQRIEAAQKEAAQVETVRHNKQTEANTVRGQDKTQEGENMRAALSRGVQLKLGGYDEHGNLLDLGIGGAPAAAPGGPAAAPGSPAAVKPPATPANPYAGLVDSVGTYKTPESVAFARVPPAIKSQVLSAVMQKYPDYDPSTFAARQKAARDFTTGQQGNAMRSFAVAGNHLAQLGELADALGNRDTQLINKLGNAIATQTGNPAPTNFDAAKEIVGKEVVKAIVAGGGGVSEREEISRLLSNAKSPAQLKGAINQFINLMSAQHDALLTQRRAAGLPDSTLPKYETHGGSTGLPSADAITAEIERRKRANGSK